ncbi:hypothetical protein S7711_09828 [Stachybotrys chartarum IBT 7711]|uniref:Uncharacterized protein n=1 Tax=Stachybotrys chartarum (strain CBS 109288 / IBT 7711) TaxID=1280523 RepID=A0A084AZT1_STACB|nr:hypothetical protein S7711_09828 [Stachybotrys chartarum IBT 7711]
MAADHIAADPGRRRGKAVLNIFWQIKTKYADPVKFLLELMPAPTAAGLVAYLRGLPSTGIINSQLLTNPAAVVELVIRLARPLVISDPAVLSTDAAPDSLVWNGQILVNGGSDISCIVDPSLPSCPKFLKAPNTGSSGGSGHFTFHPADPSPAGSPPDYDDPKFPVDEPEHSNPDKPSNPDPELVKKIPNFVCSTDNWCDAYSAQAHVCKTGKLGCTSGWSANVSKDSKIVNGELFRWIDITLKRANFDAYYEAPQTLTDMSCGSQGPLKAIYGDRCNESHHAFILTGGPRDFGYLDSFEDGDMGKGWSDFIFTSVRVKENDIREVNTRHRRNDAMLPDLVETSVPTNGKYATGLG